MNYSLHDCTCKPDEAYPDGTFPEYHDTPIAAWIAYRRCKNSRATLCWGIHLSGQHFTKKLGI